MSMPDIEVKSVTKRFGQFEAVKDLNLEVEKGELISFLGPSGCGKTTTLRMIAGFDMPTQGEIIIQGEDVATIMLALPEATCIVDLSFATPTAQEIFPQTLITVEGSEGVIQLDADYRLNVIRPDGTETRILSEPEHPWTSRPWHIMQDSALQIQRHWVACLCSGREPENTGKDNLKTLELVFGAYESTETGEAFHPSRQIA